MNKNELKSLSYIPKGRRACLNIVDRNVQEIIYCYRKGQDVSRTKDCPRCRFN